MTPAAAHILIGHILIGLMGQFQAAGTIRHAVAVAQGSCDNRRIRIAVKRTDRCVLSRHTVADRLKAGQKPGTAVLFHIRTVTRNEVTAPDPCNLSFCRLYSFLYYILRCRCMSIHTLQESGTT